MRKFLTNFESKVKIEFCKISHELSTYVTTSEYTDHDTENHIKCLVKHMNEQYFKPFTANTTVFQIRNIISSIAMMKVITSFQDHFDYLNHVISVSMIFFKIHKVENVEDVITSVINDQRSDFVNENKANPLVKEVNTITNTLKDRTYYALMKKIIKLEIEYGTNSNEHQKKDADKIAANLMKKQKKKEKKDVDVTKVNTYKLYQDLTPAQKKKLNDFNTKQGFRKSFKGVLQHYCGACCKWRDDKTCKPCADKAAKQTAAATTAAS
mmetsp:Transcript_32598/g.82205  ORF Transcript_32598/g.82205 Transcript_32598/m.82205 type:complete len:267 (-) Transcript_32598:1005-1805(-)